LVERVDEDGVLIDGSHLSCNGVGSTRADREGQESQNNDSSNDTSRETNGKSGRGTTAEIDRDTRLVSMMEGVIHITVH
jgi:hypothetical protein